MNIAPHVFVVDDQPAMLKALSRLLVLAGHEVALFGSAQEFLDSGNTDAPGCLVLDLSMPDMDGMALQRALVARENILPVIFLTGHGDIDTCVQAMKFGAADFLTKPFDGDKLLRVVQQALEKNRLSRVDRAEHKNTIERLATLTPREREVLDLVLEGKMNKQAAAELGTVEQTIKFHRAAVMTKMKVRSLAQLVRQVERSGVLASANGRQSHPVRGTTY